MASRRHLAPLELTPATLSFPLSLPGTRRIFSARLVQPRERMAGVRNHADSVRGAGLFHKALQYFGMTLQRDGMDIAALHETRLQFLNDVDVEQASQLRH